jgi:hypothetical protein
VFLFGLFGLFGLLSYWVPVPFARMVNFDMPRSLETVAANHDVSAVDHG